MVGNVKLEISIKGEDDLKRSLSLAKRIGSDLRPAFKNIADELRIDLSPNFTFDQPNYPALSKKYATRKRRIYGLKPILFASGKLARGALKKGVSGHIERVGKKGLKFGTSIDYALYIQFGTKFMPKRRFYFLKDFMINKYTEIIDFFIRKDLRKLGLINGL